ncbi:MAG TPA: hypothetical protein ENK86_03650 [Campylobacterales bacterium]|nr:hypothetical protein [Campylobacterales bacterium]
MPNNEGQPQGLVRTMIILVVPLMLCADVDTRIENSNFTLHPKESTYNYNRLRLRSDCTQGNFFGTLIGDGVNYYGKSFTDSVDFGYLKAQHADTPFQTQTPFKNYGDGQAYAKLYRLYGGYEDEQNRVVIGLQNIAMGVGRIWTPTNIFNPKNSYALEPDETFGVAAISYTRHLNGMSDLTIVSSQKEDESFKSALRYKAFVDVADIAVNLITSDDTHVIGYEIEGNLGDTGVEVRSEGAYIEHELTTDTAKFTQMIIGADYGFENGVTLIGELLYSSKTFERNQLLFNLQSDILGNMVTSNAYGAVSLSKSFTIFLDGSVSCISSVDTPDTQFLSAALNYTLNDYHTFTLGALLYEGKQFEGMGDTVYLRYGVSF